MRLSVKPYRFDYFRFLAMLIKKGQYRLVSPADGAPMIRSTLYADGDVMVEWYETDGQLTADKDPSVVSAHARQFADKINSLDQFFYQIQFLLILVGQALLIPFKDWDECSFSFWLTELNTLLIGWSLGRHLFAILLPFLSQCIRWYFRIKG